MKIETWEGNVKFIMAPMFDFKQVLGMDFLCRVKSCATTIPVLDGYPWGGDAMYGHKVTKGKTKSSMLSMMQLEKALKKNEVTYLEPLKLEEMRN